ncbi:MAG: hypothetical protein EDM79_02730 [Chloroflexi bacterium]|nr:MAG: hypothetical protein EDM79_02730 [Chloroflexota bacterium]
MHPSYRTMMEMSCIYAIVFTPEFGWVCFNLAGNQIQPNHQRKTTPRKGASDLPEWEPTPIGGK